MARSDNATAFGRSSSNLHATGTSPSRDGRTLDLTIMSREPVMKRPVVNISPGERAGRVLVGAVGFVGAIALLASAASAGIAVLEVLLMLAGIDLIVTGALGHCPLYARLGHRPKSPTGRPA